MKVFNICSLIGGLHKMKQVNFTTFHLYFHISELDYQIISMLAREHDYRIYDINIVASNAYKEIEHEKIKY